MTSGTLRILRAEVDGALVDVDIVDGAITSIVPAGSLRPRSDHDIEANGGALLPGLHDHHVHLLAMAAAMDSVQIGDRSLASALRAADAQFAPGEWIRAIGFHESQGGEIDRAVLDALVPDRPIRVQHRTGAMWVLNSVALQLLGEPPHGASDGRLFRNDEWLRERLDAIGARRPLSLRRVGEQFASYGVTGVTDLTPTSDPSEFALIAAAVASGALPCRVAVTGSAALAAMETAGLERGPVKIVIDDHELPEFDEVLQQVATARAAARAVALHCVTREALALAYAVLAEVGASAGDRIEHGAVIPPEMFADLAALGVVVVTQPSFVRERGDQYLLDVDVIDRPDLWRCASLVEAGIGVAFGSDAPYASADPWAMLRTSVDRRTSTATLLGPHEALAPQAALDRLLGSFNAPCAPRRVAVGVVADLCLLDRPLVDALTTCDPTMVRSTIVGGIAVFGDGSG